VYKAKEEKSRLKPLLNKSIIATCMVGERNLGWPEGEQGRGGVVFVGKLGDRYIAIERRRNITYLKIRWREGIKKNRGEGGGNKYFTSGLDMEGRRWDDDLGNENLKASDNS